MSATLSANAPAVLRNYYEVLEAGTQAYGDGAVLRPLLTPHLDFTGALAGHIPDATEGFLKGVAGFIDTVTDIDVVQDVHDDSGSAVHYVATMPGGPVTFTELFTIEDGRIASLRLHFDGPDYLAKGGR